MTQPKSPWDLDVRVRERNLKKGILDPSEVEKYLKDLPDAAAQVDEMKLDQPALSGEGED